MLDAESHLRAACSEAEGWPFVEDRLAWYEADRGDAVAAAGRWRSIDTPDDDPDLGFAARFAATLGPEPGRNEPCWCGSGRKFKQCHLGSPALPPLPDRVGWIWRKAVAYLQRRGGAAEEAMAEYAWRAGATGDQDAAYTDPFTADVALHEGGWFTRFLAERGPLLPADEAALGASWPDIDRTVYEVLAVARGEGMDVGDRRTGACLRIIEHTATRAPVTAGTLLCARAVPDGGGGLRFVGAVLPVAARAETDLREMLDIGDGAMLLDWASTSTT